MLGDVFYNIDADIMVLGLLFVIFFALINFALYRALKDKGTAGVVSFCVSLLAVYGISRTNWDVSGLLYGIGISENILYTVVPFIILAGLIFIFWRLRKSLGAAFMLIGIILIVASFFVYEKLLLMGIGIGLFIIGLFLWFRKRRLKKNPKVNSLENPKEKEREKEKVIENRRDKGIDILIDAAKRFNKWANSQPNPKFVGGWTYFVNYLKKGGWGGSAAEISARLGISEADFTRVFNKYGIVN
jgi:hypothetical protein